MLRQEQWLLGDCNDDHTNVKSWFAAMAALQAGNTAPGSSWRSAGIECNILRLCEHPHQLLHVWIPMYNGSAHRHNWAATAARPGGRRAAESCAAASC